MPVQNVRITMQTVKQSASVDLIALKTETTDQEISKFLSQLEEQIKTACEEMNTLIDNPDDMPIDLKLTVAAAFMEAVGGLVAMIISRAYLYLNAHEDKFISFQVHTCLGQKTLKMPVHVLFQPMYN